jgi:hypothetical protein
MTFDERVLALAPLGLTERQTRFVVTVALHGGYCLRRQYATFAGVRYGKNVRDFLDGLVHIGVASRFTCRTDRGHVYHIGARSVYRAIEQEDNRNRRHVTPALIARKLMLLDFVLAEPGVDWYATEEEKVRLFRDRFGVPESALPRRRYEGERVEDGTTTRFFVQKLPIYLAEGVPHFVYLATELGTHAFEQFLQEHQLLLRHLSPWVVVCARPDHLRPLPGCQRVFDSFLAGRGGGSARGLAEQLVRYFSIRQAVERDDLAGLSAEQLHEFRNARRRFGTPAVEQQYASWLANGGEIQSGRVPSEGELNGRLVLRQLAHPYEQFGTLAGVA